VAKGVDKSSREKAWWSKEEYGFITKKLVLL
jgi:hypothetical protein